MNLSYIHTYIYTFTDTPREVLQEQDGLMNSLPGLDFTNLISDLDNTASEIVTYQRDSTVQRKDLAQKTKDFRKLDDNTKLTEIKALLKGNKQPVPFPLPLRFRLGKPNMSSAEAAD